jgi:PII-like signaling protein
MAARQGARVIADALKLSVYFGEAITAGPLLSSDALMNRLADPGILAAALLRGIEGFGINRRIHAERFPDVSTDLPLLAFAVDTADRIRAVLDDASRAVPRGLFTLERARLATGSDVAGVEFPEGPGRAPSSPSAAGLGSESVGGRRTEGPSRRCDGRAQPGRSCYPASAGCSTGGGDGRGSSPRTATRRW